MPVRDKSLDSRENLKICEAKEDAAQMRRWEQDPFPSKDRRHEKAGNKGALHKEMERPLISLEMRAL